jgi:hypothetical protein
MGTFAVPEDWTDKNIPSGLKPSKNLPFIDAQCLLELRKIVNEIIKIRKKKY